jgi:signal transduction histidine kinase
LENGTVQLNLRVSHLGQLLNAALAATSQVRPDRKFEILRVAAAEEIYVKTDPDRLVQVFINVIANARKYCDAGAPSLRIALRQRAGKVIIDFIDNGSGLPKPEQGIIFEKFSRLNDEGKVGGAGLGLAICREIMLNLGGNINYLPGQRGAAFRVTVPLRLESPS